MDPKIGLKIHKKRQEKGITLKELAGGIVTSAQISAIEKGKCKPNPVLLEYISKKLDTDIDYFILTDEEMIQKNFNKDKELCKDLILPEDYVKFVNEFKFYEDKLNCLDNEQKGFYYNLIASDCLNKSMYIESFNSYMKSVSYYLQTDNMKTIGQIYVNMGNCQNKIGNYEVAIGYYVNSIKYSKPCDDVHTYFRALYNICICYISLKKYNMANKYMEYCLDFIKTNDWPEKLIFIPGLNMLKGSINLGHKDLDTSLLEFQNAYEKYNKENNFIGMGKALNNCAICLCDKGEYERAEEFYIRAIDYKKKSSDPSLVDSYVNVIQMYKEIGKIGKCIDFIETAEEELMQSNDFKGLIKIFEEKFEYFNALKEYERAEISAFLALNYIQGENDNISAAKLYIKLSEMYKNIGDSKSCIEYALKVKSILK